MKKIIICTSLIAATAMYAYCGFNSNMSSNAPEFSFKNSYAIVLGYDKSMGEKTIKAAVIDSYFREVAAGGKIIRWNKSSFPLKVFIQDTLNLIQSRAEFVIYYFNIFPRYCILII